MPDRTAATAVVGVEQRHDVELDLGVRAVEVAQQARRRDPPADHVDAQRAAAGAHGGGRALRGPQQFAGVGQERLPVDGELGRRAPCG